MGLFGKIFKVTAKGADELFTSKVFRKGTAKASQAAGNSRKTAANMIAKNSEAFTNKGTLKTTAAVANQGVSEATAGGRKVSTAIAKNAKDTIADVKIGSNVINRGISVAGYTAIGAIPALTGIGLYNSYKNSTALTDEDRRVSFLIDMQEKANGLLNGTPDNLTGDPAVDADPTARGNTGVGGNSSFNPFSEAYGTESDEEQGSGSGSSLGLIAGVAAVAAGGYYIYKKSKKGKK